MFFTKFGSIYCVLLFWWFSGFIRISKGKCVLCENQIKQQNCRTLLEEGKNNNGLSQIQLTLNNSFSILCDQQIDGGGWTVIQQRFNGNEPFWNQTWQGYKDGFGVVGTDTNFYAGNELIHLLSNQYKSMMTLRIELWGDRNPNSKYGQDFYTSEYLFKLNNESADYTAQIAYLPGQSIEQSNASNGWYDLTYSNGVKFSTIDHINDPMVQCQRDYHLGGWWTHYCGLASLNGEYVPSKFGGGYGLFFTVWGRYAINPIKTRMLIRDRREEDEKENGKE